MKRPSTSFILKLLVLLNAIAALLLLCSGYSFLLNPARFWFISITGLVFPVLFIANLLAIVFWILIRRKYAIISLTCVLLCIPTFCKTFALNINNSGKQDSTGSLRLLSWNVGLMNLSAKDTVEAIAGNRQIIDAIRQADADVVCLQEFLTSLTPDGHYNFLDSIKRTLNYPNHYFSIDYDVYEGFFVSGTLILSRLPITDSSFVAFPGPFRGSVVKAGVRVGKDTIDVISSRLQSLNFKRDEYAIFTNLKKGKPKALKGSRTMIMKLKYAYAEREEQVRMISNLIERSKHPVVFTGDLNDVPASFAYYKIRGKMEDSWIANGWGIGRTFRKISPTLRIDYIFHDRNLSSFNTSRLLTTGSDHYGLVTDLRFR